MFFVHLALATHASHRIKVHLGRHFAIDILSVEVLSAGIAHCFVYWTVLLLERLVHGSFSFTQPTHFHGAMNAGYGAICSILWHQSSTNEVVGLAIGRSPSIRCTVDSIVEALCSSVVLSDHLLMQQLIGDTTQARSILLEHHPRELSHVDKATIEDNLSLRVFLSALQTVSLDLAFVLEGLQEALRVEVYIAKDHSLEALMISKRQLLDCNVVLLWDTNGQGNLSRRLLD